MNALIVLFLQTTAPAVALDNAYTRVVSDSAPCATTSAVCRDRVLVAKGDISLRARGESRAMHRGDVAVFGPGESYIITPGGSYFEVLLKSDHPPVKTPARTIRPEGNVVRFDGPRFMVFEERLPVGAERPTHSHSQRVVIQLNRTRLQQWPEGDTMVVRDIEPDRPGFNEAVIHRAKNVGDQPLRGIVIELKAPESVDTSKPDPYMARALIALAGQPIIDGHNDLPWRIREDSAHPGDVEAYDLRKRTPGHTDLARLKQGRVGAQFWSIYIPGDRDNAVYRANGAVSSTPGYARVQLEQIDIARRVIARYPEMQWALTSDAVRAAIANGRVGSLLGLEGGHAIENSLALLRTYYEMGARYMTLTHNVTLDWSDAALDSARHGGLTPFGREVVREMNRLGMLVDLSHVSPGVMSNALDVSEAPVIFSHSGARALVDYPRNVPDSILARMPKNGGVVMVPFVTSFVSKTVLEYSQQLEQLTRDAQKRHPNDSAGVRAEVTAWQGAHPAPKATIRDVADVIDHVRQVAGVDHVGIGSDFDGITDVVEGLEDVSKYPSLFAELARRGWTQTDLKKLAGGNILRVLRDAERVSARLKRERSPSIATIEQLDRSAPRP